MRDLSRMVSPNRPQRRANQSATGFPSMAWPASTMTIRPPALTTRIISFKAASASEKALKANVDNTASKVASGQGMVYTLPHFRSDASHEQPRAGRLSGQAPPGQPHHPGSLVKTGHRIPARQLRVQLASSEANL